MEGDSNLQELLEDHYSLLTPYGYQSGSCGYCKDPDTSGSYYADSKRLTVDHYQDLIDRSWRRSGSLLYKPDVQRSCCPHYTIRLPARDFRASRDQRQALHRWNKFVLGEEYMKEFAKRHPLSKEEKRKKQTEFDLNATLHEAECESVKPEIQFDHCFEVSLESNEYTEEKYKLFEQYQRLVHKEKPSQISKDGFKRFLCTSPLRARSPKYGSSKRLGSYHQCYRLDGKLIALGVLDLLPHAVSSVYLIYDVAYEKYSFGKLSALRETSLALEGGYEYYYMGFYIHSCQKMRYKNDYKPQYILDADTYQWDPLDDEMKARLDRKGFISLSRDRLADTESGAAEHTVSSKPPSDVLASPKAAEQSGQSLMEFRMPGLLTQDELDAGIDLSKIMIKLGTTNKPQFAPTGLLVGFEDESSPVKQMLSELVACVGLEVAQKLIVDFTR